MKPALVTGASGFLGWHVARVRLDSVDAEPAGSHFLPEEELAKSEEPLACARGSEWRLRVCKRMSGEEHERP